MSDEKNLNNEEELNETTEETVEETIEETVEETAEAVEEAVAEDAADTAEEIAAEDTDANENSDVTDSEEPYITFDGEVVSEKKSKSPVAIICAVVVLILAVAALVLYLTGCFGIWFNKYNKGYIDTTGRTIEEVAEQAGMKLEEFLEMYDLPKNMPKNTYESAAFYTMPVSKVSEVYGMTFEDLKEQLQLPDSVKETDKWGDVEGEVELGVYIGGEELVEDFKAYYELGDDINAKTKWKEIRVIIDTKQKEEREAAEKAAAEEDANAEAEAEAETEDIQTEESAAPENNTTAE